jgi:hypothetical protein
MRLIITASFAFVLMALGWSAEHANAELEHYPSMAIQ